MPIPRDPASGHGLLAQSQTNTVWAYDPDKVAWASSRRRATGGKRLAYLDPALNAVVVIDGTTVWAYHFRAV